MTEGIGGRAHGPATIDPRGLFRGLPRFAAGLVLFAWTVLAGADTYLERDAFLEQAFPGGVPEPGVIWLTGERGKRVTELLGNEPPGLRQRYWQSGPRTAWILEKVGKEKPITAGFVVEDGKLRMVRILIYRESRGWEVRYPFFTEQFEGAALTEERTLNRSIDNISGATLSVRAVRKMARTALYLHSEVTD